jgi:hypothetical protein
VQTTYNYTSGLRVFTEKSVPSGDLREVAWFDVDPENDAATFEGGTWSNYSWFDDGIVGVSSIDRGFFVLTPKARIAALTTNYAASRPESSWTLTVWIGKTMA